MEKKIDVKRTVELGHAKLRTSNHATVTVGVLGDASVYINAPIEYLYRSEDLRELASFLNEIADVLDEQEQASDLR